MDLRTHKSLFSQGNFDHPGSTVGWNSLKNLSHLLLGMWPRVDGPQAARSGWVVDHKVAHAEGRMLAIFCPFVKRLLQIVLLKVSASTTQANH
jgi:hypothetical protein